MNFFEKKKKNLILSFSNSLITFLINFSTLMIAIKDALWPWRFLNYGLFCFYSESFVGLIIYFRHRKLYNYVILLHVFMVQSILKRPLNKRREIQFSKVFFFFPPVRYGVNKTDGNKIVSGNNFIGKSIVIFNST